jgi:hypothetical protein
MVDIKEDKNILKTLKEDFLWRKNQSSVILCLSLQYKLSYL